MVLCQLAVLGALWARRGGVVQVCLRPGRSTRTQQGLAPWQQVRPTHECPGPAPPARLSLGSEPALWHIEVPQPHLLGHTGASSSQTSPQHLKGALRSPFPFTA